MVSDNLKFYYQIERVDTIETSIKKVRYVSPNQISIGYQNQILWLDYLEIQTKCWNNKLFKKMLN